MARTGHLKPGLTATGLALVVASALPALLALLATGPADAASRFKAVTRTFSNPQQITIPSVGAATPSYPSEIPVGGLRRGKVLDANLTLVNLSHSWSEDVDVMVSHRGVDRTVMSDAGGGRAVSGITLELDDEAASQLPQVDPLTAGAFKPVNYGPPDDFFPSPAPVAGGLQALSGFDGKNPNGPWQLWVSDDDVGGSGQVALGWSIRIKARVLR